LAFWRKNQKIEPKPVYVMDCNKTPPQQPYQPTMSLLAESQIVELAALVNEIVPPGEVMMDNFEELLRGRIEEKTRAKYAPAPFMGTCVMPTSEQLKLVDFFGLPFMPSCVRYVGCKAIKYSGGLMLPCGGKIKNSDFCVTCVKKAEKNNGAHEYGTLDEREDAHDQGVKYSAGGKTEITFGDALVSKKKTREEAKAAIRAAGLSINIPEECFARSAGEKKRSGRPKKAETVTEDDEAEDVSEAPKPKVKKPAMTAEEKIEKFKQDLAEKDRKAAERAAKAKENKEKKEKEEAEKALKKAEKLAKAAEQAKQEAESGTKAPKKKKATAEKVSEILASFSENAETNLSIEEATGQASEKLSALEDDTGSLNGDDSEEESEPVAEQFKEIKVKGIEMIYSITSLKVFPIDDETHSVCVGEYLPESKSVSFYTTKPSRAILEDQLENEIEKYNDGKIKSTNGEFLSQFYVNGKVHVFDHKERSFKLKKTGEVIWVLNDDDKLVKPPVEDDDE
jgi:hypothetical protein